MIERVYIIYSADILGVPSEIEEMSPVKRLPEQADAWDQTEGDEQYDFGYLGDEDRVSYYPFGYLDREGLEPAEEGQPCGEGLHRKWVGDLSREQWLAFADAFCIDLDDNELPRDYEPTMGSITEYGHLPAISVDNTEGWTPTNVIYSTMYCSFAGEPDPTIELEAER